MKILFIRNAGRFSGSETYNVNLFQELQRDISLQIYFLTNLQVFAQRVSRLNITTRVISWGEEGVGTKRHLVRTLFKLPVMISRYISVIRQFEQDERFKLICLQSMSEKVFLTPVLKIKGYKVVWTELGPLYATQMSRMVTFLYKLASLCVDKIITISEDTKKDLITGGVREDKVKTLYIGVDTNQYKPISYVEASLLKKKLSIRQNASVIGFLGTVTDEKGIEDFVEISKILHEKARNYHFVVIGDGPFLSWVKKSVSEHKMTNCYTYAGFVQDVRPYLRVIDILLLPTRHHEGLPLAILEAQSMGKIVITSNMGGNSEIIANGRNGFFYTRLHHNDIVKLIESLATHKPKMDTLGVAARQNIITRFNIRVQARKFIEILKNL